MTKCKLEVQLMFNQLTIYSILKAVYRRVSEMDLRKIMMHPADRCRSQFQPYAWWKWK